MKKYMMIIVSLFSPLTGMEIQRINPTETPLNVWELFSTPNNFDKAIAGPPLWDQNAYNNKIPIHALANLHILKNNRLETNNLVILDAQCGQGHTSAYLAQKAKTVIACDKNPQNISYAEKKYIHNAKTLKFNPSYRAMENFFDLIVSCASPDDMNELENIYKALKPHGNFFCILTTEENTMPLELKVIQAMLPKIKKCIPSSTTPSELASYENRINNPFPTLEIAKTMAQTAGFNILSCEQQKFDILIQNKENKQNFIKLHESLLMHLLPIDLINSQKKRAKLLLSYLRNIVSKMKKDADDNWLYPIDKTVFFLRKPTNC